MWSSVSDESDVTVIKAPFNRKSSYGIYVVMSAADMSVFELKAQRVFLLSRINPAHSPVCVFFFFFCWDNGELLVWMTIDVDTADQITDRMTS